MNSCWHPAYADDFDEKNHLLKMLHSEYADYVVYGSQQAMLGAERYLGPINLRHCRIFNAVDITHFTVGEKLYARPQVLAAGLHQFTHRLKPLILAMPEVAQAVPDVELVIAGKLVEGEGICDCGPDTIRAIVQQSGFKQVRFIDTYTQQEAPEIYRRANVLVHLKHMDWTPNVVAEAMACGVPVVHTGNGGTPEIVDDAGVSLNIPADWDHILEADPAVVAAAIVKVLEEQGSLAKRAREIAYTRFNLEEWIREHEEIFSELLQLR
ncbi:MAG: glycosyltransferase [Verrucomicrobiota bacterium]